MSVPPGGEGPALLLDETDMTHLDLHVGSEQEQRAEVERLVALGARRVDWVYPEGANAQQPKLSSAGGPATTGPAVASAPDRTCGSSGVARSPCLGALLPSRKAQPWQ